MTDRIYSGIEDRPLASCCGCGWFVVCASCKCHEGTTAQVAMEATNRLLERQGMEPIVEVVSYDEYRGRMNGGVCGGCRKPAQSLKYGRCGSCWIAAYADVIRGNRP